MDQGLEKQVVLFKDIGADCLPRMLKCLGAKITKYMKGEIIILADDRIDSIGIVLLGSVLITREDFYGNRSIISMVKQYEVFGEAFVCTGIMKSPVTVTACENCEVMWLQFPKAVHQCPKACEFHGHLIENMMILLASKNYQMHQKIEVISQRNTRDKILTYLYMQAKRAGSNTFDIPLDRNELADFLYVDRSALSRELGRMKNDGLLDYSKNHFMIKIT
ncbi:MAG: Crp/Fnr family transcriptional regulator [Clostridia bacterium]